MGRARAQHDFSGRFNLFVARHFCESPEQDVLLLGGTMLTDPEIHRMKILVIDDDRPSVTLLEQLLQRHGYTRVLGVTNSRVAIQTCAEFDPDLILLDLMMPEVDGFAILENLRGEVSERFLPVVILTADITEDAKARALEAGATDFLVKPVSQTEALLRIRNLLETRRLNVLLRNQRAALEDAVRERTNELREKIAELENINHRLLASSVLSGA